MKKIIALLLLLTLSGLLVTFVLQNDWLTTPTDETFDARVSNKMISKSVTESTKPIEFGETVDAETGSANMVTSIVVNYRSFDTLGEVTVLFISALSVSILIGTSHNMIARQASGFILRVGARVVTPLLLLMGFYVITHGHLTPGGGFQGGAMLASAALLMILSDPTFKPVKQHLKWLEGTAGTLYVAIGLIGLVMTGYFLKNVLPTGTVGSLFSAGIIPIVYLLVGLKVGSEITSMLTDFMSKEANA